MASFNLVPIRPFEGFSLCKAGVKLEELRANVVSASVPNDGYDAFMTTVKNEFGVSLPIPNQSTLSPDKSARVVWSTPDQYLIYGSENISKRCFSKLSDVAYMTDQSHATVAVRLSGSGVWDILERISPVDMHRDIFRVHHVTRIATDHISITILRESEDGFILSSPSSSAGSFLHILTTTIEYLS